VRPRALKAERALFRRRRCDPRRRRRSRGHVRRAPDGGRAVRLARSTQLHLVGAMTSPTREACGASTYEVKGQSQTEQVEYRRRIGFVFQTVLGNAVSVDVRGADFATAGSQSRSPRSPSPTVLCPTWRTRGRNRRPQDDRLSAPRSRRASFSKASASVFLEAWSAPHSGFWTGRAAEHCSRLEHALRGLRGFYALVIRGLWPPPPRRRFLGATRGDTRSSLVMMGSGVRVSPSA